MLKFDCDICIHLVPSPTLPTKQFVVELLPTEKNEHTRLIHCKVSSSNDIHKLCAIHRGSLVDAADSSITNYVDIVDRETYSFAGAIYDATKKDLVRRQTDDKVLEHEGAVAVQEYVRSLGHSNVHTHHAEKFYGEDNEILMEVDAIVHVGGEKVKSSIAYLVEAAYSPLPTEVDVLENKVRRFIEYSRSHPHYKTVKTVIPVLVGRRWFSETLDRAKISKLLIVKPNGSGYSAIRLFSTFVKLL
jgi:hypothetical protein